MNYYEHHLGDFARDAGYLSMQREGAYRRMIDVYYATERPLPNSPDDLYDVTRCSTKAEREAVDYCLQKFFELKPDGYHQKRCDEEIARYKAKSEAAKASANARWSNNGRNANASANGMRTHKDRNALQSPVSNPQSPVTNNHSPHPRSNSGVRVGDFETAGSGWKPPTEEEIRAGK